MIKLKNIIKHLKLILKHKYYVCKYCFKFGLYWQGIVHDLSKFNLIEFWTSVKYYQGNRSPVNAEKEDKGYSVAWMHHYHRNKHHWMYWIDFDDNQNIVPLKIPYKYLLESIADWISAGIVYEKDKFTWREPYEFYRDRIRINNKISETIFHPKTRMLYDRILVDLASSGLDWVCYNIKNGWYKKLYNEDDIVSLEEYNFLVSRYYMSKSNNKSVNNKNNIEDNKLIYLFLDIDGVLNNQTYIERCYENNGHNGMSMYKTPFDPECLQHLMILIQYIEQKGYIVEIILSSTWRLNDDDFRIVNSRLGEYGLMLRGKTPYIHSCRGKEIQKFIDDHMKPCYYIVLDDDVKDIIPYHDVEKYVINTTFKNGFNSLKLIEAINKFNNYIELVGDK